MSGRVRGAAAMARQRDIVGAAPQQDQAALAFAEIDCVRALLDAKTLADAEDQATASGVGADRVLIASGAISEDDYLQALAVSLGTAFEPLDGVTRDACPLDDARLIEAAAAGLVPLADGNDIRLVIAPRGTAVRRLLQMFADNPAQASRFRFTSAERLNRFVMRYAGKAIAARASDDLKNKWPLLSAARTQRRVGTVSLVAAGIATAALALAPAATILAIELFLAVVFLAWLGLRLFCAVLSLPESAPASELSAASLPVYNVIAALYREAASVDGLLSSIERLDYPGLR